MREEGENKKDAVGSTRKRTGNTGKLPIISKTDLEEAKTLEHIEQEWERRQKLVMISRSSRTADAGNSKDSASNTDEVNTDMLLASVVTADVFKQVAILQEEVNALVEGTRETNGYNAKFRTDTAAQISEAGRKLASLRKEQLKHSSSQEDLRREVHNVTTALRGVRDDLQSQVQLAVKGAVDPVLSEIRLIVSSEIPNIRSDLDNLEQRRTADIESIRGYFASDIVLVNRTQEILGKSITDVGKKVDRVEESSYKQKSAIDALTDVCRALKTDRNTIVGVLLVLLLVVQPLISSSVGKYINSTTGTEEKAAKGKTAVEQKAEYEQILLERKKLEDGRQAAQNRIESLEKQLAVELAKKKITTETQTKQATETQTKQESTGNIYQTDRAGVSR
jgi:hypothetical protein